METVPQLDFSVYPSQIVWFICAFGLLYLAVRCVVVPRVESEVGARVKVQDALLSRADCAYACVHAELLRQKALLDNAEKEARSLVDCAIAEVAAAREEALRLLNDEISGMASVVEEQLEVLKRSSRDELVSLSSGVATMYYARVSGAESSEVVKNEAARLSAELYGESI